MALCLAWFARTQSDYPTFDAVQWPSLSFEKQHFSMYSWNSGTIEANVLFRAVHATNTPNPGLSGEFRDGWHLCTTTVKAPPHCDGISCYLLDSSSLATVSLKTNCSRFALLYNLYSCSLPALDMAVSITSSWPRAFSPWTLLDDRPSAFVKHWSLWSGHGGPAGQGWLLGCRHLFPFSGCSL